MTDGVKFIFKTLIKVPIIIFVSYFIFNIFVFCFTYFRMLGFSYVVMQTAVENNYLPTDEYTQLNAYLTSISNSEFIEAGSAKIVVNAPAESEYYIPYDTGYTDGIEPAYGSVYSKRQYGKPVRVGVIYKFRMVWPLMPHQQVADSDNAVAGLSDDEPTALSDAELELARDNTSSYNVILITYTVPGLKYYPDLLANT